MIIKSPTVANDTECTHCGLPVPAGLIEPEQENQFCCNGCSGAWRLIHDAGLDSFYGMADASKDGLSLRNRDNVSNVFAEFDTENFLNRFANHGEGHFHQIKLALDGIHCAACIWLIEKLPNLVQGVVEARVNW